MRLIKGRRGLTLIETIATATVVAFVVLGLINLISTVYKSTISTKAGTTAFEVAMDNIEKYRAQGFDSLQVNPSGVNSLAAEQSSASTYNYYYYDTTTENGVNYQVYRTIKYAVEDSNGDLVPVDSAPSAPDIKVITVDVQYFSVGQAMTKTVEEVAYVSNRDVGTVGSTIKGTLSAATGPALSVSSNPIVYVTGHPELMAYGGASGASITYSMTNVQPGSYSLYASATGYWNTTYTSNPVVITNTVQTVTANIALTYVDTAMLTGTVYMAGVTTLAATGLWNGAAGYSLWTANGSNPLAANDSANYSTTDHTNANYLRTDFAQVTPTNLNPSSTNPIVVQVQLNLQYTVTTTGTSDDLKISVCQNHTGSTPWTNWWTRQPNPWGVAAFTNATDSYYMLTLTAGTSTFLYDITPIYDEGNGSWSWTAVNNLGMEIIANPGAVNPFTGIGIDVASLTVYYSTGLPPLTSQVSVAANDLVSQPQSVNSQSWYTIPNTLSFASPGYNTLNAYALIPSPLVLSLRTNLTTYKGETKTVNFGMVTPSGAGTVQGTVLDATTNAPLSGVPVIFTSDATGNTYSGTTNASGVFTINSIQAGSGKLTATKTNYQLVGGVGLHIGVAAGSFTTNLKLFMNPIGTVSGTVTNSSTSAAPSPPVVVRIQPMGGGNEVDTLTDPSTGNYTVTTTAGSYEVLLPGDTMQTEGFTWNTPPGGIISNINLGTGSVISGQNFTVNYSFQPINGTVKFDNITSGQTITDGALIIAQPASNTIPPYGVGGTYFSTTQTGDEQNSYYRTAAPSYACEVKQDGTYRLMVPVLPSAATYSVYAFYTADVYSNTIVSYNSAVPVYQKTMTNYYKVNTSVSPGSASNFSGSWSTY